MDIQWAEGRLQMARIFSDNGSLCKVRADGAFRVVQDGEILTESQRAVQTEVASFITKDGQVYQIQAE